MEHLFSYHRMPSANPRPLTNRKMGNNSPPDACPLRHRREGDMGGLPETKAGQKDQPPQSSGAERQGMGEDDVAGHQGGRPGQGGEQRTFPRRLGSSLFL